MGDHSVGLTMSFAVLLSTVRGMRRFIWMTFVWQSPLDPLGINRPMIHKSKRAMAVFGGWQVLSIFVGIAAIVRTANAYSVNEALAVLGAAAVISYAGSWALRNEMAGGTVEFDEVVRLVALASFLIVPVTGWLLFRFTEGS